MPKLSKQVLFFEQLYNEIDSVKIEKYEKERHARNKILKFNIKSTEK